MIFGAQVTSGARVTARGTCAGCTADRYGNSARSRMLDTEGRRFSGVLFKRILLEQTDLKEPQHLWQLWSRRSAVFNEVLFAGGRSGSGKCGLGLAMTLRCGRLTEGTHVRDDHVDTGSS